ncbi:hypothetical protein SAMN05421548_1043 [Paraburkholderia lycopersici]|uniref:Fis family transcriptional regulator n=2 Tax=Paraburkholderia lycopersici TaxID=416944 RepID=A0A1G6IMS2_9BURK|nr:hypothetical protein SAMN05421548_1043 [Paraburkholderia lycopersici]
MVRTIPFPHRSPAGRARRSKSMLLPIPHAVANELALQVHLALAALRRGGTGDDARAVLHAHVLAQSIAEAGYGALEPEQVRVADVALIDCFERGNTGGGWQLDEAGFEALAGLVTVYDRQLQSAPLWALTEASERLERMGAGETSQQALRKSA